MNNTIEGLYSTFAGYKIDDGFSGCECCINAEDCKKLTSTALSDLTFAQLERYSRKAVSTWGHEAHLKHFLPRLLELSVAHRDDFLDLAIVFGKIRLAGFDSWPETERDAVRTFFAAYWEYQLQLPVVTRDDEAIDSVLCALANAESSVQPYLNAWLQNGTGNAVRHLAAFILRNDETLLQQGTLFSPFWENDQKAHDEVLNWLVSDPVHEFLALRAASELNDQFVVAVSQLIAIRSAFEAGPF